MLFFKAYDPRYLHQKPVALRTVQALMMQMVQRCGIENHWGKDKCFLDFPQKNIPRTLLNGGLINITTSSNH
jgi:hypothetical protein